MYSSRKSSAILAQIVILALISLGSAFAEVPYFAAPSDEPYLPEYGLLTGADTTRTLSLSGTWELNDGSDEWRRVPVPGCWKSGQGEMVLRRQFDIPQDRAFDHHRIVFWAVRANAAITLNGRLLKTSEGDWPRIVIDLPEDILRYDRPNDLLVELDDRLSARESIPLKPKLYDPQSWSGIYADVILLSVPLVTIDDITWKTELDEEYSRADWALDINLRAHAGQAEDSLSTRALTVHTEILAPGDPS